MQEGSISMSSLYDLTGKWLTVAAMLDDPEVDRQTIADTLDSIEGEIEQKADGYAKIISNMKAEMFAIEKEISRLNARRQTIDNNIDALRDRLTESMVKTGKLKFHTNLFGFGIQKSPPAVRFDSEDAFRKWAVRNQLTKYYEIQEPKILRAAVLIDLKKGVQVPYAELSQTEHLVIR